MEDIQPNDSTQQSDVPMVDQSKGKRSEKRRLSKSDGNTSPSKRARYHRDQLNSSERQSGGGNEPTNNNCSNISGIAPSRYIHMKKKAKQMKQYCHKLNQKMQELVKTNMELASLLLTLLESVDVPGSPKLEGAIKHLNEGETKKAILERINLLLERAGMANFPGALGEILYNDLFMELRIYNDDQSN